MITITQRTVQQLSRASALRPRFGRRIGALALAMAAAAISGCSAAAQPLGQGENPDLSIGRKQFPDDDAIILRWEQHWTLTRDGAVHRRDHKWVKLLDLRAIDHWADPRIDFNGQTDKVVIHTARTYLPDGSILPVPDYSFNDVGPSDIAGWPEYAPWRQTVVCFSGIENGCVLEFDYEVTTQEHILPWITADLRLHQDDPTVRRIVSITAPSSTPLRYELIGAASDAKPQQTTTPDGMTTLTWDFPIYAGDPDEPQSPPWQNRCGRLAFTTCPSVETWVAAVIDAVHYAAEPDDRIRSFARKTVGDEKDPLRCAEQLTGALSRTFNFITAVRTMRTFQCRPAREVLRSNYGHTMDTGALLIGLCRSLGIDAQPAIAVDSRFWIEDVPLDSTLAGVLAVIETDEGPLYVHPQHGVLAEPGTWGRRLILTLDEDGRLRTKRLHARGETKASEFDAVGRIALSPDGTITGEIELTITGAFFDPSALDTSDSQRSLLTNLAGRLLPGVEVAEHTITTLTDETLAAMVKLQSHEPLEKINEHCLLTLGEGPAFLADFPLPLDRSYRRTDVQLAGRVIENVDLTITIPDEWRAWIVPASLARTEGSWGSAVQSVSLDDSSINIQRRLRIDAERLSPIAFAELREAVNALRATASRHLLLGP